MRRTIFLTSLKTVLLAVPLFAACGNNSTGSMVVVPPGGITLPDCMDGQLIAVDANRNLSCTQALTAGLQVDDCAAVAAAAGDPAGTVRVLNAYDGTIACMMKGSGSTNNELRKAIDNIVSQTATINNTINSLRSGGSAAKYCGLTAPTANGAIVGNGITGIAGAAYLCQQVQGCGAGAHMCTVYEMVESVDSGTITAAQTIARSWVFMASWQHKDGTAAQIDPTAGLNDNCGGYTYPTADKHWYGTAVEWKAAATGQKALHFWSGPGGAPTGVPCSSSLPIACCN
jgi:hypothetical protein